MDERNNNFDFDFTPIGQAIKKAREARGMTREQLSGIIGYAPRHIQSIENEGQYPSIELFIQLITMFDVSVDEYIFPDNEVKKSSVRRRLDAQLDNLDDKELSVIEATVIGLCKAKEGVVKKQRSKSRDFLLLGNLDSFLCQIAKITILAEFWVQQTQRHKNCVFAVLKMWKIF